MDDKTRQEYEARAQKVRADLKQWEADWAKAHDGKKPGRDDIKNNPSIAQKYKDYNKLRDIVAGKIVPPSADSSRSQSNLQKRKSDVAPVETPLKRTKYAETPSKQSAHANGDEFMNSPAVSRKLFSPAPITTLGPTPQRDGKVLGLFDLLVEKELGTPSRKIGGDGKSGGLFSNIQATPSGRRGSLGEDGIAKLGRTPTSASKRFVTPLKKKDGRAAAGTPTSVSKLQFDTPAFLKRHSLPTLDENTSFDAPAPLRLPRKPLVRGLSEIVANLRKVEEENLDEDLEALREAEGEEFTLGRPIPKPPPPPPLAAVPAAKEAILEPDSQAANLPLGGFDDEGMYDSHEEEARDRSNPMRIFKKKGQKRTTRRANIRPTRTKRPTNLAEGNESEEDEDGEVVADTQGVGVGDGVGNSDNGGESDGEFDGTDEEDDDTQTSKSKSKSKKPPAKKEGVVKKVARKVNELAHANFHRLKLRNNGAKGGPGYNSRFRRRR